MRNDDCCSRRQFGTTLGGIGVATMIAGCSAFGLPSKKPVTASTERSLSPESGSMSRSDFAVAVDNTRETYGENGIWGLAASEPDHGLEYVGAWQDSAIGHRTDDEPAFTSDHLLVLYRLPGLQLDGEQFYRAWLWSGAVPEPSSQLEAIRPSIHLVRDSDDMRRYDPASTATEGPVPVSFNTPATPGPDGPTIEFPLHAGKVEYAAKKTEIGDAGGYGATWTGAYDSVQGVNATCVMKWPADRAYDIRWNAEIKATPK
ncbi:hypothetical protein [Halobacterium salinarum]|uniref:Uncharacterized protein n=6 Tax=Halobacterium salinarum TaxID=2242 RepID=A0A510N7S4_HALSA|nr:hypothetical protein [Halobacterium salinarum]MBB6089049.1 hypothetical protein [Halobacterium salinarum]MDL0136179.1 hypothetical protein [Halobacterium salinarum]MDL0142613.1 hypothetical protein [Halobacterium salinarum]MDL0143586.1 hypothetical protein [Halobacterium salinarum]QCC45515.1 uncharacterized protein HBSAL_09345 [Halobacterium salinarum]